jgi:hypothetical protein
LPLVVPDIPGEVVSLLEAGLDEDPDVRPSAERFAVACYGWATPEPVDLYPSASPEVAMELPTRRRAGPRPRPRRRPVLLAAGAGLALAVGGGVLAAGLALPRADSGPPPVAGQQSTSPGPASTTPVTGAPTVTAGPTVATSPTAGLGANDLAEAAAALGPARAAALVSLDRQDVGVYSLPDSPAYQADLQLLAELRRRDLRYEDLALQTEVAGPIDRPGAEEARVPLRLTISPYRTVTTAGETVDEVDAPTAERFTAELVRTDSGWRVHRILGG